MPAGCGGPGELANGESWASLCIFEGSDQNVGPGQLTQRVRLRASEPIWSTCLRLQHVGSGPSIGLWHLGGWHWAERSMGEARRQRSKVAVPPASGRIAPGRWGPRGPHRRLRTLSFA